MKPVRVSDLAMKLRQDPVFRRESDPQEELALVCAMMHARVRAGLTVAELARRMKTTQSAISRLESGRIKPSTRTLERYARATGHRLVIGFEPAPGSRG